MAKLIVYDDSPGSPGGSTGVTAALVGVLSSDDIPVQRRAIRKLLTAAHSVVLDVTDLRIQHGPAVKLLSTALLAAGGWPSARLVVLRPDGRLTAALETTGVARDVHVVDSVDCAITRLQIRPRHVSRRIWLQPNGAARRHTRSMVTAVCHEWRVPHLVRRARTVESAVVDSAFTLGQTRGVLNVSHDDRGLRIALRDFRSAVAAELEPATPVGLALDRLSHVSDDCGITPLSDGKTVWAVLRDHVAGRRCAMK